MHLLPPQEPQDIIRLYGSMKREEWDALGWGNGKEGEMRVMRRGKEGGGKGKRWGDRMAMDR